MKRIFIDTNVVIDFLARRSQFFNSACGVISCSQKGYLILVSSLSFATTSYILAAHHKIPEQAIKNIFANFVNTCRITTVDTVTISDAISSQFTDFEDAMQYSSALHSGADVIISRNKSDFQSSIIPVYEPQEFLDLLTRQSGS